MKLLVFAHTPPPHHGQSYMVQLMLEGLGGDEAIHVNARFSDDMEDIGKTRFGKVWRLLGYIGEAWKARFREGARAFYHIPAPGKRSALYRDWVIYLFCRPIFPFWIQHWHAVGLGQWLETEASKGERLMTRWLTPRANLAIAVTESGTEDAHYFKSKKIELLPNGIPDPCPDFDSTLLSERRARWLARSQANCEHPVRYEVLFMAHCTEKKGLFDALEAVALARLPLAQRGLDLRLTVAGTFPDPEEQIRFEKRIVAADLLTSSGEPVVSPCGFLESDDKDQALRQADCYLFPSHWESFGLVLLEAMAYGLPIVTVAGGGGGVRHVMPSNDPGLIPPSPSAVPLAEAVVKMAMCDSFLPLRHHYLNKFTLAHFHANLRSILPR